MRPLGSAKPFPLEAKNHQGGVLPVICRMLVSGKAVLPCRDRTCTSSAAKSQDVAAEIRSAQRLDVGLFTCVRHNCVQPFRRAASHIIFFRKSQLRYMYIKRCLSEEGDPTARG